jgi:aspartate/methionine/tyrosine aminotransferase
MSKQTIIDPQLVRDKIKQSGLVKIGLGSIREIVKIVNDLEAVSGIKFIRMEIGSPGLPPSKIGVQAEIEALKKGVASVYPNIEGHPELKKEASRFVKLFMNITVSPQGCIPSVGAVQGTLATYLVANRTDRTKEGTLFIDPGFPLQKRQCVVLGHTFESFDVYNYRGKKLRDKLESYLKRGKVSSILYSNPNNPTWICFTEEELQIIGELATKYDAIVIEDLAYFGMDFRKNIGNPGQPPFQPTVANYTDNYLLLISSSKAFSYAGQRIGLIVVSDTLYKRRYPDLKRYYTSDEFGYSMIYGALYALSAGVSHSAQHALAAILKAANDGEYHFLDDVKEYGKRAAILKAMFVANGFSILYDKDIDVPIADGFYFTVSYPGISGVDLVEELLYYGIGAISLKVAGSELDEGVRACVSYVGREKHAELEKRLKLFHQNHPR